MGEQGFNDVEKQARPLVINRLATEEMKQGVRVRDRGGIHCLRWMEPYPSEVLYGNHIIVKEETQ